MGALRKPEPFEFPSVDETAPPAPRAQPAGPVLLTRMEPPVGAEERPPTAPAKRTSLLRPYPIDRKLSTPFIPQVAPSFRNLVLVGAGAVLLAICLGLVLGFSSPRSSGPRPASPVPTTLQTAHPAKPSAYGEAFLPARPAPRNRSAAHAAPTANDSATLRN